MSNNVLPRRSNDNAFVTATDKWTALAEGAKFMYDGNITAEQMEQFDTEDRADGSAWWEENVHNTYHMHNGERGSLGGWIMAVPTGVPNIWQVFTF